MKDIWEGKGFGYLDKDGKKCMVRCFKCGRENWSIAVPTGKCSLCEYDANSAAGMINGHSKTSPR